MEKGDIFVKYMFEICSPYEEIDYAWAVCKKSCRFRITPTPNFDLNVKQNADVPFQVLNESLSTYLNNYFKYAKL